MIATLSIKKYIGYVWSIERQNNIREKYKKLSELPDAFIPKFIFVNNDEFEEAVKVCGSDYPREEVKISSAANVDINWVD